MNFDGSKLSNGQTSYEFVFRNSNEEILLCGANAINPYNSNLVAESRGLREGIRGALSLSIKKIWIEGDNLFTINSIKNWKIPWSIDALIVDAAEDLKKFEMVQGDHIVREANRAAD